MNSTRKDDVCALNEHKNTMNIKNMHYPFCRVNLNAATFDLLFYLGKMVTHVIIINNGRMNSALRDDACALNEHKNTTYIKIYELPML